MDVSFFLFSAVLFSCTENEEKTSPKHNSSTKQVVEKDGMVLISGTKYVRGNDQSPGNGEIYPEEGPAHEVEVSSFWIDKYEVTNADFKAFVDETGYVTFAEKQLTKEVFS